MKELHIYTYDVPFEVHSKGYCEEHIDGEGVINTYDLSLFSVWASEHFTDVYIHWRDKDSYRYTSIKEMLSGKSRYYGAKHITCAHNMQRLFLGYIWEAIRGQNDY